MGVGDRHPVIDPDGNVIGDYVEEWSPEPPPIVFGADFAQDRATFMMIHRFGGMIADRKNVFVGVTSSY